jgi:hypothetical protein
MDVSLRMLPLVALALAGAVAVPAPAAGAGWNCSANALSGQPATPPTAANVGALVCQAASAGGSLPVLPAPLHATVVSAQTTLDGPAGDPMQQVATATTQVSGLGIGIPANVPINVPTTTIFVPLVGTVDLTSALRALVPVPSGNLVDLVGATTTASGRCTNGSPDLVGSSQVTGLNALGQALPTDHAFQQGVNVVNATTIDPSNVNISGLPAPVNTMSLVVQPLLDALPNIAVPATVGQVGLTPGAQSLQDGTLTQQGPRIVVSVAGQPLADLTAGQASVSRGDVVCARDGGRGGPDGGSDGTGGLDAVPLAQLACTSRKLALIDVLNRGRRTRFYGAADPQYVGRRVDVVSLWNGKAVARPTVLADGTFAATAALPPKALRSSNRARYQARIGGERSLELKLYRRMLVEQMTSRDGTVTIKGRVLRPLAKPVRAITIKRRVSCTSEVTVRSVKPDKSGRFAVTIPAPPTGQAAVYRLQTSVPRSARNPKLFPTYTLPRAVELRR